QEIDGAVHGDEVDLRVDALRPLQNLVHVEVLLRFVHHLQDGAALAGHAQAAVGERLLKAAGGVRGVNALTDGREVGGGSNMYLRDGQESRSLGKIGLGMTTLTRGLLSRVDREPPQNVMIHDDGEEYQKEDEADLDVALFKGEAEVAA